MHTCKRHFEMEKKHRINNKKKILLVIRWPVGGIRTYIRYVYRNFDFSKWELTILAPDLKEMKVLVDDLSLDYSSIRFIPIRGMPTDGSSGILNLIRHVIAENIRRKYDLVHSHGYIAGLSCAVPVLFFKIPHLMTSHDVLLKKQFKGHAGIVKRKIMKYLLSLIDVIHSVSYDARENLLLFFPNLKKSKNKCIVIPNGIEIKRFQDTPTRDLRAELKIKNDIFIIGFFGRFMAQKGFKYLIDAIEILDKRKNELTKKPFVVAFGSGAFENAEKRDVLKKGVQKRISFMPFTPNVAGVIKGVDAVVMPSLWEACGLVAMEALVCGTPLIASDCIGLREVLDGTPARIIPEADALSLANAIEKEMTDSLKTNFYNFTGIAAKKYDVKKTSEGLERLYESLINDKGP